MNIVFLWLPFKVCVCVWDMPLMAINNNYNQPTNVDDDDAEKFIKSIIITQVTGLGHHDDENNHFGEEKKNLKQWFILNNLE